MQRLELNLARNCLKYLVEAYEIKELWLPYYICPVMRKINTKLKFYHIDRNFMPLQKFGQDDYILYPNYFGICAKNVELLSKKYKNLIIDNAHSFFMPHCGLASFNSVRKFFPTLDGAYLFCDKELNQNLERAENRKLNLQNDDEFLKNELFLNSQPVKLISESSKMFMQNINLEEEKSRRIKAFKDWHVRLKETNELQFELGENDVPYVYPYLTKDDDFVEKNLKDKRVLRLWNSLPKDFPEYDFYRHLVPIPL